MAQDVILIANTWIDLTAAFGLTSGQTANIQNTGSSVLRIETSIAEPINKNRGIALKENEISNASPEVSEKIWGISVGETKGKAQRLTTVI